MRDAISMHSVAINDHHLVVIGRSFPRCLLLLLRGLAPPGQDSLETALHLMREALSRNHIAIMLQSACN